MVAEWMNELRMILSRGVVSDLYTKPRERDHQISQVSHSLPSPQRLLGRSADCGPHNRWYQSSLKQMCDSPGKGGGVCCLLQLSATGMMSGTKESTKNKDTDLRINSKSTERNKNLKCKTPHLSLSGIQSKFFKLHWYKYMSRQFKEFVENLRNLGRFFKLRNNTYIIKCTFLKCIIQWVLLYSQSYATITII